MAERRKSGADPRVRFEHGLPAHIMANRWYLRWDSVVTTCRKWKLL